MKIKEGSEFLIVCISFLFLLTLVSCKNKSKPEGFVLQRFDIINPQLDSLIRYVEDSIEYRDNTENLFTKQEVLILLLRVYNSHPEFCFGETDKKDFSEAVIYRMLSRVVGYIETGKRTIIVLSTDPSIHNFEMTFYKFILPTEDKHRFDFIYFPDDLYYADENGWPLPPPLGADIYQYYAYNKGKFDYMNYAGR